MVVALVGEYVSQEKLSCVASYDDVSNAQNELLCSMLKIS